MQREASGPSPYGRSELGPSERDPSECEPGCELAMAGGCSTSARKSALLHSKQP